MFCSKSKSRTGTGGTFASVVASRRARLGRADFSAVIAEERSEHRRAAVVKLIRLDESESTGFSISWIGRRPRGFSPPRGASATARSVASSARCPPRRGRTERRTKWKTSGGRARGPLNLLLRPGALRRGLPQPVKSCHEAGSRAEINEPGPIRLSRTKAGRRGNIVANSLDQNPPEAAEAGAVWHFARVRYSHFLSDQVCAVSRVPSARAVVPILRLLVALSAARPALAPSVFPVENVLRTLAHMRRAGRRFCLSPILDGCGVARSPGSISWITLGSPPGRLSNHRSDGTS